MIAHDFSWADVGEVARVAAFLAVLMGGICFAFIGVPYLVWLLVWRVGEFLIGSAAAHSSHIVKRLMARINELETQLAQRGGGLMSSFELNRCVFGDALEVLRTVPDQTFHCAVSSPPYWRQRDYGHPGQIGLEAELSDYLGRLVEIFRELRRALRDDGTFWLNIGDTAAASGCGGGGRFMKERGDGAWSLQSQLKGFHKAPPGLTRKNRIGVPWRLAFALQDDGWILRQDIIWHKPSPQPESVKDRPSKAHEYVFLFSKCPRYFYDAESIREPRTGNSHSRGKGLNPKAMANASGSRQNTSFSAATARDNGAPDRNARSVWTIPAEPYPGEHFAPFPKALVKRCVLAGSPAGGCVVDPFFGSGTVGRVAEDLGRSWFGIELVPKYAPLIAKRTAQTGMMFADTEALRA